jgi:hypothetical protein
MTQKFSTGAFVFTRTRGLEPRDPADLEPVAVQHGIDAAFIPSYPGDRVAISRALTHASRGLQNEGFLLRPIRRTSADVVYGIVREQKDESLQRLDHDFEATISWSAEPDPSIVTGDHDVASRVREAFNTLRGKIVADDWSASITTYLESHDAARMRGDGRVYWVPPQRIEDVRKLSAFLATVGIDLILCEIEPEVQTVVQDVAQVSIDEELDRLQAEAAEFDGKQKPSTYARRLDDYQRLRNRAVLYRDALGVGVDRAKAVLDELEQKVSAMLDLRRQTTIHRDGSMSGPETGVSSESEKAPARPVAAAPSETNVQDTTDDPQSAPVTEGEPSRAPVSIRFAGALFTLRDATDDVLTYTSDEAAAKSSAAALESMGLAGKWQQAGPVRISIQNSGPEGAAVSLRFQVPASQTLRGSATALSTWGIQLDS